MRGVTGQWALEVLADGKDLGLDASNITGFTVISNIHQHLPTVSFGFKDPSGQGLDDLIVDGAPLSVSIGHPDNFYTGQYRAMGMPNITPYAMSSEISLQGVLDNVGWMKKVVDKSYKGKSSDVISQIAQAAGMIADVDPTNDLMTWLPNSTTLVEYARHVAERSFSSATSAMILATTDSGKVRFKDLDKLISAAATAVLSDIPGEGFPIDNWSATPKSRVANAAGGYGATSIGVKEDGSIFEGNKIQMTMMSGANSISSFFQSAIGDLGSRINNLVPLSGNTHEFWNQALHQNPRIKSAYAFDVEVVTHEPTKLELLDTVDFNPRNRGTGSSAQAVAGKYIVTAVAKTIVKQRYFEKIVLTAQGAGGV